VCNDNWFSHVIITNIAFSCWTEITFDLLKIRINLHFTHLCVKKFTNHLTHLYTRWLICKLDKMRTLKIRICSPNMKTYPHVTYLYITKFVNLNNSFAGCSKCECVLFYCTKVHRVTCEHAERATSKLQIQFALKVRILPIWKFASSRLPVPRLLARL